MSSTQKHAQSNDIHSPLVVVLRADTAACFADVDPDYELRHRICRRLAAHPSPSPGLSPARVCNRLTRTVAVQHVTSR